MWIHLSILHLSESGGVLCTGHVATTEPLAAGREFTLDLCQLFLTLIHQRLLLGCPSLVISRRRIFEELGGVEGLLVEFLVAL